MLAVSSLADGTSLRQTLTTARADAAFWDQSTVGCLSRTSEPALRALAVEDTAALAGVAIAGAGLVVHALGGPALLTERGGRASPAPLR